MSLSSEERETFLRLRLQQARLLIEEAREQLIPPASQGPYSWWGMSANWLDMSSPCPICHSGFSWTDWEERHSSVVGEDIHVECCETAGPCSENRT